MYSASYSDVDENGIIRMMLCRVIMGNVEVVLPGSMQFQPIAGIFDSGVDDLQKPKHYVIWDANVHRHIYAEYAVIIKSPSMTNGTTTATHMVLDFISLSIFYFAVIYARKFI
jgi:hypothetical protein